MSLFTLAIDSPVDGSVYLSLKLLNAEAAIDQY